MKSMLLSSPMNDKIINHCDDDLWWNMMTMMDQPEEKKMNKGTAHKPKNTTTQKDVNDEVNPIFVPSSSSFEMEYEKPILGLDEEDFSAENYETMCEHGSYESEEDKDDDESSDDDLIIHYLENRVLRKRNIAKPKRGGSKKGRKPNLNRESETIPWDTSVCSPITSQSRFSSKLRGSFEIFVACHELEFGTFRSL